MRVATMTRSKQGDTILIFLLRFIEMSSLTTSCHVRSLRRFRIHLSEQDSSAIILSSTKNNDSKDTLLLVLRSQRSPRSGLELELELEYHKIKHKKHNYFLKDEIDGV
jgi:hypothetical protein